jgi:Rieske 2Fe-2S family protein
VNRVSAAETGPHLSASTPEGTIYWDEPTYRNELERLFYRNWLMIGREEQLAKPGDYLTRQIGHENILFVRGSDGAVRGFYNLCRHRGTRILYEPQGTGLRAIQCPYHAWSYALDGRLVAAPETKELPNFRKDDYGLYPIRVDTWGGFLWARLDAEGPSLSEQFGDLFAKFRHVPLERLRLGAERRYEVAANWKILVENYSECYHCALVHPDLNRITPYFTGDNDAYFRGTSGSAFAGGYMTFAKDYTSMTTSGYTRRAPLPGLTEEESKRISYYVLFPNTFFSLHPDYLMVHRTWPVTPGRSVIENEFYFDPEEMAKPDFDPNDAVEIWDTINRQDWAVCEGAQLGTRSRVWHGGRYSATEEMVHDFDAAVRARMRDRDRDR